MNKISVVILSLSTAILFVFVFGHPVVGEEQAKTKSLTIVLIPEKNESDQIRRYRHISNYLAAKLDISVRLSLVPYDQIAGTLAIGETQAGFFGSFGYTIAHTKTGIIPLVRPVWKDGTSTYAGYLVVRKDGHIKTVADMKNTKLVLVSKTTTAGYVFPKTYFLQHGVSSFESYFSKVLYARSHENAAWAVYSGEADVGAINNHIFNDLNNNEPDFANQMKILAESKAVPSNSFAVSPDMEPGLRDKIRELLLNMHLDEQGSKNLALFGAKKSLLPRMIIMNPAIKC